MNLIIKKIKNIINVILEKINLGNKKQFKSNRYEYNYNKLYRYDNNDGKLYEIFDKKNSEVFCIYNIINKKTTDSITVKVYNIYRLKNQTKKKIIDKAEQGNLEKAQVLIKRYQNIKTKTYSHRLQVLYKNNHKYATYWIIDGNFDNFTHQSNENHVKNIFYNCLIDLINEAYQKKPENLMNEILKKNWDKYLFNEAQKYYKRHDIYVTNLRTNVIFTRHNQ